MQIPKILLVDDEQDTLLSLSRALSSSDYQIQSASQIEKALELQQAGRPAVAVVDLSINPKLGVESGFGLIRDLLQFDASCRVIVLTGHASAECGLKALSLGAANFLQKPADLAHLKALIRDGLSQSELRRAYFTLLDQSSMPLEQALVGVSAASKKLRAELAYAASNSQSVLLLGETGTGKGLCAQLIHRHSARAPQNFVRYQPNFASSDLVASELFGHRKGAFTGADSDRKGLLAEADKGTLFLDEVDELPPETQVSLLGVLQDQKYRALGSNTEEQVDVRLICATNQNIQDVLDRKKIRADFFHRTAHCKINIAPLRERLEDIESLAKHFLSEMREKKNVNVFDLDASCLDRLQSYNWPGNIRELQAALEGASYRAQFEERHFIMASDLNLLQTASSAISQDFHAKVQNYKRALVEDALKRCDGNQVKAAKELGLDRSSLRRLLASSQIKAGLKSDAI